MLSQLLLWSNLVSGGGAVLQLLLDLLSQVADLVDALSNQLAQSGVLDVQVQLLDLLAVLLVQLSWHGNVCGVFLDQFGDEQLLLLDILQCGELSVQLLQAQRLNDDYWLAIDEQRNGAAVVVLVQQALVLLLLLLLNQLLQ